MGLRRLNPQATALANHVNDEKTREEMRRQLAEIVPVEEQLRVGLIVPHRQLLQTAEARVA